MNDSSRSAGTSTGEHVDGLSAAEHQLGHPDARVLLVQYGDYECPACVKAEPLIRRLVNGTKGRLRFVYRHFPLMELHQHAELAAEAAEAAAAQDKFWPMHHQLFDQKHHLELPALTGYAEAIGLDMNRFKAEMADRIYTQRVQEHRRAAEHRGVRTVPAFFLNGKPIDASSGFDKVSDAVHAALAAA